MEVKSPEACFFADNDCSNRVDILMQRCFNHSVKRLVREINDDLDVEKDNNRIDIYLICRGYLTDLGRQRHLTVMDFVSENGRKVI